jgi:hypothetical protein
MRGTKEIKQEQNIQDWVSKLICREGWKGEILAEWNNNNFRHFRRWEDEQVFELPRGKKLCYKTHKPDPKCNKRSYNWNVEREKHEYKETRDS